MLSRFSAVDRTRTVRGSAQRSRRGLTLLEVLVSTAIFLMALVAIARLISLGSSLARDAQAQTDGLQLARTKLNEVVSGVTTLQAQSDQDFDSSQLPDPNQKWTWSLDCNQANIPNLWTVKVTAKLKRADGSIAQVALSQMVLDPATRGFASKSPVTNTNSTASGSGSSSGATTSP
jgi:prepilin-type N-terminal cleavage/methylation domain-containing protein